MNITADIKVNRTVTTQLNLGEITYTHPETYTTDKISEIVVVDNPSSYNVLAGQYGTGDLKPQLDPIYVPYHRWSPPGMHAVTTGFPTFQGSFIFPSDESYYPQVDFYSRYNQWFATATWNFPYMTSLATAPASYAIKFIYNDRTTKTTYTRDGVLFLNNLSPGAGKISISSAIWNEFYWTNRVPFGSNVQGGVTNYNYIAEIGYAEFTLPQPVAGGQYIFTNSKITPFNDINNETKLVRAVVPDNSEHSSVRFSWLHNFGENAFGAVRPSGPFVRQGSLSRPFGFAAADQVLAEPGYIVRLETDGRPSFISDLFRYTRNAPTVQGRTGSPERFEPGLDTYIPPSVQTLINQVGLVLT